MSKKNNLGIAPQGYHERYYNNRDWRSYTDLLAKIVRFSQPGPILDLGAGCGYLVEAARQWGLDCVGLEGSPDAIKMAKQRVPDLAIKLHRLSDELPFDACSFQTVVLNQVIEHLEPDVFDFAMREVLRTLRPSGMVLVLSPARANKKEWRADPTHINLISPKELRLAFIKYGLVNIVPFDTPLYLLGNSWIGRGVMFVIFKMFRLDALSATANALAYKIDRQ